MPDIQALFRKITELHRGNRREIGVRDQIRYGEAHRRPLCESVFRQHARQTWGQDREFGAPCKVRRRRFLGQSGRVYSTIHHRRPARYREWARNPGRSIAVPTRCSELLACVEREDPLADSVIKPDAAAIKRRRFGAKPWRVHGDSATEPERVSHTPRGGGVALAAPIALTRFSTPVTARHTNSSAATPSDRSATMATLGRPVQTAPDTEPIPPSPGRSPVDRTRLVSPTIATRRSQSSHTSVGVEPPSASSAIAHCSETSGRTRGTKCAASSSVPTLRELDAVVAHAVTERMVAI